MPRRKSVEEVRQQLNEALAGVQQCLADCNNALPDFTDEDELRFIATKLLEYLESLDAGVDVPILGFWRRLEHWPYDNELRTKVVGAEFHYEKLG